MAEGGRDPSGSNQGEVYLCPICNTRVGDDVAECPGCGAIFVDDEAQAEAAEAAATDKAAVEYRCPACGGSVAEDDEVCPHCGAYFVEDAASSLPPEPKPAPRAETRVRGGTAAEAEARARPRTEPEEPGPQRVASPLEGRHMADVVAGRPASTLPRSRSREREAARRSRAVRRLTERRKLIAKRQMLGMSFLAIGFLVYILSLMAWRPEGFTLTVVGALMASFALIVLGVLILYNQRQAFQHYQRQLQTARVEAALLRERAMATGSSASTAPQPEATPPPARVAPVSRASSGPAKAARAPPRETTASPGTTAGRREAKPALPTKRARETPVRRIVTGAAAEVEVPRKTAVMERAREEPRQEPEKVPCPNCGYMNRNIFVRCIRCGTELAQKEESIAVETFERPEPPATEAAPRPRGGPTPWEARHATSQGGRAAARQAARQAARVDEEEVETDDRRAAIGVAANFAKLPRNMREELIRTLYKVADPVVRQDTVSAIAEHYTELPKDIQDLILDLADDEDPRVREEVAFEVNRNFDRIPLSVVQTIFAKLAKDPENLVREDVVSAIAENFQRLPKETQDLLKALARDQQESVRDEVSFEVAKNSDVIPEKFKSEIKEILKGTGR